MPRRKKKQAEGAPEWMVTYGDMMTLLLCFFVIIVSMSEIKQDQRFQDAIESIKKAFGYEGGVGKITGTAVPNNTMDRQMTQIIMRKWQTHIGKSTEEGIEGENPSVKTIREGLQFTIGGQVNFEPGKARLLDEPKKQLDTFAEVIRGMNNKVRIRGHAARKPEHIIKPFRSLDELSFARAEAVKDYLVSKGIREERITCEACGDNEPLIAQAYDESSRGRNRRVDIIWTSTLVEDYKGRPASDRKGDLIDG